MPWGVLRVRTSERGREIAVKYFDVDVPAQTSRGYSLQEKGSFQVEYVENALGVGDCVLAEFSHFNEEKTTCIKTETSVRHQTKRQIHVGVLRWEALRL